MSGKGGSPQGARALIISWYEVCSFIELRYGARSGNGAKPQIAWKEGKGHAVN